MMKFEILCIKEHDDAQFRLAFEQMSLDRKERCQRYKFSEDRRRMAFADMALRKLLEKTYDAKAEDIKVFNLKSGKPAAFVKDMEVCVSISHSGDYVACAVSDKAVGIDIETPRDIKADFARRVLSSEELCFAGGFSNKMLSCSECMEFLKIWTAKEAYLKLSGEGLKGFENAKVLDLIKNKSVNNLSLTMVSKKDYVCSVIEESSDN